MCTQLMASLVRSPLVVWTVIGSLVFGLLAPRAEGRAATNPPTIVVSTPPMPHFGPEEAIRHVLSQGFGLQFRTGQVGLALQGQPEHGAMILLVLDRASPTAPVAIGTFLNPNAFPLPGMSGEFELPGMTDAVDGLAQRTGIRVAFSIMPGLIVTPQWTGAVSALAMTTEAPNPSGGTFTTRAFVPLALANDLSGAIESARRLADFFNGTVPDASWRVSGGGALQQSQETCVQGCMDIYNACRRLAAAEQYAAGRSCTHTFAKCQMGVVAICSLTGKAIWLCFLIGQLPCLAMYLECMLGVYHVLAAKLALCEANLRNCLLGCGVTLSED